MAGSTYHRPAGSFPLPWARFEEKLGYLFRELVVTHYVQVCQNVGAEVGKRWEFEQSLRGNLHTRPTTKAELTKWRKYLDFEEKADDFDRISFLFERCLEEFWLRYVRWMYD